MATKGKRRANGDGWIFKDGDGYRVKLAVGIDSTTGKAKYRSARVRSHADAVKQLQGMQSELGQGKLVAITKGNLSSFLEEWLENHIKPNKSASTYRQYRWLIEYHIKPILGKKRVQDVRRSDVKSLVSAKSTQTVSARSSLSGQPAKTLSHSTLRLIKAVLHSAFSDAIKDGFISINPASHVDVPKSAKQPPVFLAPEQAIQFLGVAMGTPLSAFWTFLISTGARVGEATGLRWQDVDLVKGLVTIQGQLQRLDSKLTYVQGTKTNQVRKLAISPSIVDQLKVLKGEQVLLGENDPDSIVFLNPEGRRLDPKYVNNQLKKVCELAGVPAISVHKLRHTAATLALSETGDLQGVKQMLGHSQVALTADLYGHAVTETQRRMSSAIDKVLRQASNPAE